MRLEFPGSLHNHTDSSNFRLRDSTNKIKTLIDYAIKLGHEVVAFTEHETVSNAVKIEKYYKKIKEKNPNFKVIRGNEIYLCRDGLNGQNYDSSRDKYFHFILLAKDAEGHKQIRKLSTIAWMRSYTHRRMVRVPTYYSDVEKIIGSNKGHVIGSTACLGGYLPTKIIEYLKTKDENILHTIHLWIRTMIGFFGKEDFYLEMQPSHIKEQIVVNKFLIELAKEFDLKYIITTDSHYLSKDKAKIHSAFLRSQDGDREVDSFYQSTYMMNTEELESYFDYFDKETLSKAYDTIIEIKNKCEDYSLLKPLRIPSLEWNEPKIKEIPQIYIEKIPYLQNFLSSSFEGDKVLAKAIIDKISNNIRLKTEVVYNEINDNLKTTWLSSQTNKAHWSAYFLNLQKIIEVCWNAGTLVGPGRGSGVGFLLLYLLDIIQINPLWEETKVYSWRFLNPDRVSVLDIDTDIEGGRRPQVLEALREYFGRDRVANVVTFGTEKSKSALQTAARGLGIDNDVSLYLSSLIPSDRGRTRTLKECMYGDTEKDFKPVAKFVSEMTNNYPDLLEVALEIEGLICRVGEHAGGVIFVDEPFTESTALMKVPNGDTVTQFDLHDCEDVSLIKIDLLSIEALDNIHNCLDLLVKDGYIKEKATLKETYEDTIGIYNLERKNPKMWDLVNNHKIQSLFQMEQQSGIHGISLIHPTSINDLTVLNSVIRLMAPDKGGEQPLDTWAKYRRNINLWYQEMKRAGLTKEEIEWLSKHDACTDGICESQEGLMSLVQEERLGGNSLTFADTCRKALAKKVGELFNKCEKEFFENAEKTHCSIKLVNYVWNVLLKMQRGYSFNRSHCLAYSLIALQEMNLCFKFPIVFWNCACLITNAGGNEGSSDYNKIASAINKMKDFGVEVAPPNINKSAYSFTPDVDNNKILYGIKGLQTVGTDLIETIINNRPYASLLDFENKVKPKRNSMIILIKSGAFDNFGDRRKLMIEYIWRNCDKKNRITLQNMSSMIKYKLLPIDTNDNIAFAYRVYEFNRYLKAKCKYDGIDYKLDNRAIEFLDSIDYDHENIYLLEIKTWEKYYKKVMQNIKDWIAENPKKVLDNLNEAIFMEDWNKSCLGSLSKWEMESICFYYHEHELKNVNYRKYNLADFSKLSEEPVVERTFKKGDRIIPIYKLCAICGTCIAKDKNKGTVTILTTSGVVNVKFSKEYFAIYDKQISKKLSDGKKKVVEKSWFNRGNMIMVQGMRRGNEFVSKKYASSPIHQLYKIISYDNLGNITITHDRAEGEVEDGYED